MTSSRSSSAAFNVLFHSACHAAFGSAAGRREELKMIGIMKPMTATLTTTPAIISISPLPVEVRRAIVTKRSLRLAPGRIQPRYRHMYLFGSVQPDCVHPILLGSYNCLLCGRLNILNDIDGESFAAVSHG